jgi:capsular exopolysaccharide synthesis family protein
MSEDQLPASPADDGKRLPAPRADAGAPALPAFANPLMVAGQEERRDDDEIDLLAYWQILVKRRWLVLGILAGVVALALLATLMATPIYRATAVLQLEKDGTQVVQVEGIQPGEGGADATFLQTQYELLQSRSLAERVANELDIAPATLERLREPGWFDRMLALLRPAKRPSADPAQAARDQAGSDSAAAGLVQAGLTVEPVRNSQLVKVHYDSPSPQFSARVANAVADGFIASGLERRFGASSYAKTYLEDQLKLAKARLEESERKLVGFAQQENLVSTGEDGQSLAAQNLTELNGQLAAAQSDRIRAASRWRQASGGALSSDMIAGTNIGALQQQRANLQLQYQQKLQTFKPDYPDMVQLQRQIEEVTRQIAGETGRARAAVKAEYDAAVAREGMLKAQIGSLRTEALDVDGRSIQYNILKREVDTNRQLYDSLLQRYKEVGVAGDVRPNNIAIIDRARVPGGRFKPNLPLNLAIGLLLGALLGVLAAFVLEFLDNTLKTPEDVEQKLRLPLLGVIPRLGAKESVVAEAGNPQSPFSEAYRSVRTALQFATDHGVPRTLLVTSTEPGEGKSTTALTLARAFAQIGKRVLLIEADMRNPSLHRALGLDGKAAGLSNLLAGATSLAQATQDTDIAGIRVICAGPLPPNPAELLAGSKLVSSLTVAVEQYDQVIIDGPPVLGLADALILANAADGTLLAVHSGKTRIGAAQAAIKRLVHARARLVGALLTKYDARKAGYGYGYGYNYHAYYAYGSRPKLTKG